MWRRCGPPPDPFKRYAWLLDRLANGPEDQHENYESLRRGMDSYFVDRDTMLSASVPRIARGGEATHLPPAWVCYPEQDQNVPLFIVRDFETSWREAGGDLEVTVYPRLHHVFGHRPGEATDRLVEDLGEFLSKHLGKPREEQSA